MQYAIPVVLGYLLGSISFSFLIARWLKGIDIRKHGSGNAGATNTLRILGVGPAVSVLLLDMGKGILAVLIGRLFGPGEAGDWIPVLSGLAAVIGHNWPIYFGFRGGKGVATTIGVSLTFALLPALLAGIAAILTIVLSRYVSLGSLLFTLSFPIFLAVMDRPKEIIYASLVILILAFVRHRSNIVKLVQGKENKLGAKNHVHGR